MNNKELIEYLKEQIKILQNQKEKYENKCEEERVKIKEQIAEIDREIVKEIIRRNENRINIEAKDGISSQLDLVDFLKQMRNDRMEEIKKLESIDQTKAINEKIKDIDIQIGKMYEEIINAMKTCNNDSGIIGSNSSTKSKKSSQKKRKLTCSSEDINDTNSSVACESNISCQFSKINIIEFSLLQTQESFKPVSPDGLEWINRKILVPCENFNWPSDHEQAHLAAAFIHFKNQLEIYIKANYKLESLESFGIKLLNVNKSNLHRFELTNFGIGMTDFMIVSTLYSGFNRCHDFLYANIEIKTKTSFHENQDQVYRQSTAQLISGNKVSDYPVIQMTTDLTTFDIYVFTKLKNTTSSNDNVSHVVKWRLNGDQALQVLFYWLEVFCQRFSKSKKPIPLEKNTYDFLELVPQAVSNLKQIKAITRVIEVADPIESNELCQKRSE